MNIQGRNIYIVYKKLFIFEIVIIEVPSVVTIYNSIWGTMREFINSEM